tara:strand:+ start:256 stop:444 length:189 start_codon:yes stop_codon:yes gene_type:complete
MVTVKVNTISKASGNNVAMQVPLNLKNLASDPADGVSAAGDMYYNTTSNKVRFRSNSAWGDL